VNEDDGDSTTPSPAGKAAAVDGIVAGGEVEWVSSVTKMDGPLAAWIPADPEEARAQLEAVWDLIERRQRDGIGTEPPILVVLEDEAGQVLAGTPPTGKTSVSELFSALARHARKRGIVDAAAENTIRAYAGTNPDRQSVGLPGHCDRCVAVGHVRAHPDLGCGDVGCTVRHVSDKARRQLEHAPVDHPGIEVPPAQRPWSVDWPDYHPVDITPRQLWPANLPDAVVEGWAERYAYPHDVPDWEARQAAALVPFELDDLGWPLNPTGRTGRSGRNLGRWGENAAADPIVVAGDGADRQVLLIKRDDIGVTAIPGGMTELGETVPVTLARELKEETGVDLAALAPTILMRTYVEDWRATDHAWVCSTVALYQLPDTVPATAGSDALAARWWPFRDLDQLIGAVEAAGETLYAAHLPLLAAALDSITADVDDSTRAVRMCTTCSAPLGGGDCDECATVRDSRPTSHWSYDEGRQS
jgi:ADP-ribose pyrophosphatase YjhB (NUDIX family)